MPSSFFFGFADVSDSLEGFLYLNEIGCKHGVGRVDVVESRFVGLKSRGVYETPGGEILRQAHIGVEGLTMDREVGRIRDQMSAKFSEFCYNGFWESPEMDMVLHCIRKSQEKICGSVQVKLFKGRASVIARSSPVYTLYNQNLASMDEGGGWDPTNSTGFIKINSTRLRSHYLREKTIKEAAKKLA